MTIKSFNLDPKICEVMDKYSYLNWSKTLSTILRRFVAELEKTPLPSDAKIDEIVDAIFVQGSNQKVKT